MELSILNLVGENTFLYWLGIATVCYITFRLLHWLYKFVYVYFTGPAFDYKSFGKWALVTGATDGIGKGIATELARAGLDIILVSRNPEKLNRVAAELESEFHVDTKCIKFDFTNDDKDASSVYDVIRNDIVDLEIGILVNNVGISAGSFAKHLDIDKFKQHGSREELSVDIINCNITSVTKVTEIVLPQMLKRQKGLVITLSSLAADVVCPTFALYSGTKKFDDTFTKAIRLEYEKHGVVIQSITPGFVRTALTDKRKKHDSNLFFPLCATYVKHLMGTLGKTEATTGFWFHHLFSVFLTWLPERLWVKSRMKVLKK